MQNLKSENIDRSITYFQDFECETSLPSAYLIVLYSGV